MKEENLKRLLDAVTAAEPFLSNLIKSKRIIGALEVKAIQDLLYAIDNLKN
jgi:hypothetical protein